MVVRGVGAVGTATTLESIVRWVAGSCGAVAAAGGFFVGLTYTLDQGEPSHAPWVAALGLLTGAAFGLLNAIAPVFILACVNGQRWAAGTPVRLALAGLASALPISIIGALSSAHLVALLFGAAATALPAAVAVVGLDWSTARASRGAAPLASSAA